MCLYSAYTAVCHGQVLDQGVPGKGGGKVALSIVLWSGPGSITVGGGSAKRCVPFL